MLIEAVPVDKKIRLKHARAQVGLSQEDLARLAHIARQVVANAEQGAMIRQISAWAILGALNRVREERGLKPLEFEEMEWKVQGEK